MKIFNENGDVLLPIKNFVTDYHPTVSAQGIMAAAKSGKLDFVQPERDLFVVLTAKTLSYRPRTLRGVRGA